MKTNVINLQTAEFLIPIDVDNNVERLSSITMITIIKTFVA